MVLASVQYGDCSATFSMETYSMVVVFKFILIAFKFLITWIKMIIMLTFQMEFCILYLWLELLAY